MLRTYRIPPLSGKADSVVIFLHGLGDNGAGGLLELGRVWQQALPNTEFLCPDAPFEFDMAPPDLGGRQWFSLKEFTQAAIETGVKTAAPLLDDYINTVLVGLDLTPARLALVGFSQGTMMSLYVAPRRGEQIACIIGYAGRLIFGDELAVEKKSSPPVLLIHGTHDAVLPFASMREAEARLQKAEIPVRTLACPQLGHSIDDAGIAAGMAFLQQYL